MKPDLLQSAWNDTMLPLFRAHHQGQLGASVFFANQNWTLKTRQASESEEHPGHHRLWSAHLANLSFVTWELCKERQGQIAPLGGQYPSPLITALLYSSCNSPPCYTTFPASTAHETSLSEPLAFSHIYSWFTGRPGFYHCAESQVLSLCLI